MGKNSMGQFIAALRKANGMTQQMVADRLNVSNKAVSRWERDECAPDLSVVPALAEMFGVTCDELLKGERISDSTSAEKKEPRIEKQVRNLVSRTLSGFKTLIWISLAVAVVGLVCMFGISYGFYRPVIGFTVMLLFEVCALVIAVLAVSRTKDVKKDNELFKKAEDSLVSYFNDILGNLSFLAFFVIFAVVLLSLPLICVTSDFVNSVITFHSYFVYYLGGIVLILALVYFRYKKPFLEWIVSGSVSKRVSGQIDKIGKKLNFLQITLTIIAGILFISAPWFDNDFHKTTFLYTATAVAGLACLGASIICFVVFLLKQKEERKNLIFPGIRNILLIPSALILSRVHSISWVSNSPVINESTHYTRYDIWDTKYFWFALILAVVIIIAFWLTEKLIRKNIN